MQSPPFLPSICEIQGRKQENSSEVFVNELLTRQGSLPRFRLSINHLLEDAKAAAVRGPRRVFPPAGGKINKIRKNQGHVPWFLHCDWASVRQRRARSPMQISLRSKHRFDRQRVEKTFRHAVTRQGSLPRLCFQPGQYFKPCTNQRIQGPSGVGGTGGGQPFRLQSHGGPSVFAVTVVGCSAVAEHGTNRCQS